MALKVIYIYKKYGYILGRKTQQFFIVKLMAQSLVKDEAFNAGNRWMKVPYKMESDSLGGSHAEDCQGKHLAPTCPTAQPPSALNLGHLDQEREFVPQPQME